jgi:hypothetical protein
MSVYLLGDVAHLSDEAGNALLWNRAKKMVVKVQLVPRYLVLPLSHAERQGDAARPEICTHTSHQQR